MEFWDLSSQCYHLTEVESTPQDPCATLLELIWDCKFWYMFLQQSEHNTPVPRLGAGRCCPPWRVQWMEQGPDHLPVGSVSNLRILPRQLSLPSNAKLVVGGGKVSTLIWHPQSLPIVFATMDLCMSPPGHRASVLLTVPCFHSVSVLACK